MLGRRITPADDQKIGAHPVVVLSYSNWQRHFGADPAIVGKIVKINRLDYTILGVMPRGFIGTELLFASDFWVPLAMEPQIEPGNPWLNNRNTWNLWVAGRLKPATTRNQAEAELNTIAVQMAREYPFLEGMRIRLSPPGLGGNMLRGPVIGLASVLMGVAGLVLLIACTNLASLLLAQASDRRKEIAVRLALGAARWRLVRQLLTENLLLAIAGSAAGLLLAVWLVDLLGAWRPPIDIPVDFGLALDWRVLTFTAAAGLLTTRCSVWRQHSRRRVRNWCPRSRMHHSLNASAAGSRVSCSSPHRSPSPLSCWWARCWLYAACKTPSLSTSASTPGARWRSYSILVSKAMMRPTGKISSVA